MSGTLILKVINVIKEINISNLDMINSNDDNQFRHSHVGTYFPTNTRKREKRTRAFGSKTKKRSTKKRARGKRSC